MQHHVALLDLHLTFGRDLTIDDIKAGYGGLHAALEVAATKSGEYLPTAEKTLAHFMSLYKKIHSQFMLCIEARWPNQLTVAMQTHHIESPGQPQQIHHAKHTTRNNQRHL